MQRRILKFSGLLFACFLGTSCPIWLTGLTMAVWNSVSESTTGQTLVASGIVAVTIPFVFLQWGFILGRKSSSLYRIWELTQPDPAPVRLQPVQSDWRQED